MSATTATELLVLVKRVAREAIAQGCFIGEPMSTGGSCDDKRAGSWLGWELRVWRDGRWNIVPAGRDRHPDLMLAVIMNVLNTASEGALVRALLGEAPMRCERVGDGISWTVAGVTGVGHNRGSAREACVDALLAIAPTESVKIAAAELAKLGALFHTTAASRHAVRGSWADEPLGGGTLIAVGPAFTVNGPKYGHDHDVTVVPCARLELTPDSETDFVHGTANHVRYIDIGALIAGPNPDDVELAVAAPTEGR
jgi:hypothetical protein